MDIQPFSLRSYRCNRIFRRSRFMFCLLYVPKYCLDALVLGKSLRDVKTVHDMVLLHTDDLSKEWLKLFIGCCLSLVVLFSHQHFIFGRWDTLWLTIFCFLWISLSLWSFFFIGLYFVVFWFCSETENSRGRSPWKAICSRLVEFILKGSEFNRIRKHVATPWVGTPARSRVYRFGT